MINVTRQIGECGRERRKRCEAIAAAIEESERGGKRGEGCKFVERTVKNGKVRRPGGWKGGELIPPTLQFKKTFRKRVVRNCGQMVVRTVERMEACRKRRELSKAKIRQVEWTEGPGGDTFKGEFHWFGSSG
jgi:hypothetical protein